MVDFVEITTGARLHFGPLFCGRTSGRRFGGVGVMIDRPGCRVAVCSDRLQPVSEDDTLRSAGPAEAGHYELVAPESIRAVAEQCLDRFQPGPMRVEIHESIPRHRGLGSGTQLALAIAQGIYLQQHGKPADVVALARMTGRGTRSAAGIHGFAQGGFVIDAGKRDADAIGALAAQCEVPDDWRFVLVAPRGAAGLSDGRERDAFARLPAMPAETSAELCRIALTELLPAVREADFPAFAEGLFEYGRIVGEYFSPVQGGCFANPEAVRLAARLRAAGVAGVAQSSWGPTVAVTAPSEGEARQIADEVTHASDLSCAIARPRNCGASVTVG